MGLNLPKKRSFETPSPIFRRMTAYLLDFLIIKIIIIDRFSGFFKQVSDSLLTQSSIQDLLQNDSGLVVTMFVVEFVIAILTLSYFVAFEYKFSQTPGKMVLKIFVNSKEKKAEPSLLQVIIRCAFKVPASFFTLLLIADIVYYLMNKERLGDRLAQTKVIEVIQE
jgi:uncharacterized RDD family membrane protein YckC